MVGQSLGQGRGYIWICGVVTAIVCLWIASHSSAAPQDKQGNLKAASRPDILFVRTPLLAAGPLAQRFPKGSEIVLLRRDAENGSPVRLTEGFFAAADPQVSFDATRLLFSGEKAQGERWQLWEMDLDGSHKRQITRCSEDCLHGAYLPADEIALTVEDSRDRGARSYLAVVKDDGTEFHPITFGPAEFQLETVLRDGRIVASAPWPLEEDTATRSLYTLRPDGTALESFRCEPGQRGIQANASELDDGTLLFVRQPNHATTGGELMRIQRGSPVAAPLGTRQAIYASVSQFSNEELLVAKATSPASGSTSRFDLYRASGKTGALGARVFSDAELSSVQAIAVTPHAVPKHYWTMLNPESSAGYFISLDSYLSADAPGGRFSKSIAQVRVITVNEDGQERSLGEAPVESDGSFYVSVPANTPVRFVLLDAKGQTIREERSWVWSRPGEERGCTGCHGDKNVAPENHWPMTLKRFDTPIALGDTNHAPATSTAK